MSARIKCEVEVTQDSLIVNGYKIDILCYYDTGLFYQIRGIPVTSGGIHYDLEEAVKYCLEI